jgi:hypothetical protein
LTTTTSSEGGLHGKYHHPYSGFGQRYDRNQFDALVEENRKLKRQNLVLQTEVSTIKYAIYQVDSNSMLISQFVGIFTIR